MIKNVKQVYFITFLEIILQHPIEKFGDVLMFVSKNKDNVDKDNYIFSIPYYNWTYEKEGEKDIVLDIAPSGFNHPFNKQQLITAMYQAIEIIKKNNLVDISGK